MDCFVATGLAVVRQAKDVDARDIQREDALRALARA